MVRKSDEVIIVGGGPAGLAVFTCLKQHSISSIILEKEDCSISLWRKRAYDRLHLHLDKQFCELPYMSYPKDTPQFLSKNEFIGYVDDYIEKFQIEPLYGRWVHSTAYDSELGIWLVDAKNNQTGETEEYSSRFLVVATGENGKPFVPLVPGLDGFEGKVVHSSEYKSGSAYEGQEVLVVGYGNSGMEIALDLANHQAKTSIVIRNKFHVTTRDIMYNGLQLNKHLPIEVVDPLIILLGKLHFGDLEKHGILAPQEGPISMKQRIGKAPVIDVGTIDKIKNGDVKVYPAIRSVSGKMVEFEDDQVQEFSTIVLATGYSSDVLSWFKGNDSFFGADGFPANSMPNHWNGKNGVYCAGFSRRGIFGVTEDAFKIADDIKSSLNSPAEGQEANP